MKNAYKRGDIILIKFPFSNMMDFKVRPALLICDQKDEDITLLPISTSINLNRQDIPIKRNHYLGDPLPVASVVRLTKITTVHSELVIKKISEVKQDFSKEVQLALFRCLS